MNHFSAILLVITFSIPGFPGVIQSHAVRDALLNQQYAQARKLLEQELREMDVVDRRILEEMAENLLRSQGSQWQTYLGIAALMTGLTLDSDYRHGVEGRCCRSYLLRGMSFLAVAGALETMYYHFRLKEEDIQNLNAILAMLHKRKLGEAIARRG